MFMIISILFVSMSLISTVLVLGACMASGKANKALFEPQPTPIMESQARRRSLLLASAAA